MSLMHTNTAYFQSHFGPVAARSFDLIVSEITSVSMLSCLCASQNGICNACVHKLSVVRLQVL